VLARDIKENYPSSKMMVVSPDVGGVVRARALAKRLDALLAIVDKRRDRPGESEVMNIIGDVAGKNCLLIDDIVDSGGTLCNAAEALLNNGAKSVTAYITHGVLSGGAVARVSSSKLKELVITDSIQPTQDIHSAPQHPGDFDGRADGRGDQPHRCRAIGVEPLRLIASGQQADANRRQVLPRRAPKQIEVIAQQRHARRQAR
jgi:predicted phosphoribosyltransferase